VRIRAVPLFLRKCKGISDRRAVQAGKTHFDLDLKRSAFVIVGQEGTGLPDELLKDVDLRVRIPVAETIDS
jgi:tRNA G18 (ribose-2'-O)-methylase SpoU